jgi:hypothetical protein
MIATIGSITDKAFQSVFTPFTPTEQPIDFYNLYGRILQNLDFHQKRKNCKGGGFRDFIVYAL